LGNTALAAHGWRSLTPTPYPFYDSEGPEVSECFWAPWDLILPEAILSSSKALDETKSHAMRHFSRVPVCLLGLLSGWRPLTEMLRRLQAWGVSPVLI